MSSSKKKLLILIDWFAPGFKAGGPVQSCVNICRLLKDKYDIYVLTTDTDHGELSPYQNIKANEWIRNDELGIHIYYAVKKTISLHQIKDQILFVKPHVMYLNLLFSTYFTLYPLWLKIRKVLTCMVVMCPRGTLYESALAVKRLKKIPVISLLKTLQLNKHIRFHATNAREKEAILKYFPKSDIAIANNLPNVKQLPFSPVKKKKNQLNCIFIARIVPIKNLLYLLNILRVVQCNINLSVIGPVEDLNYWNQCKKAITELAPNISVHYLGAREQDKLNGLIQQHHLFILPTEGENFGHAIFESLLAGRPVLISDQTPWQNLVEKMAGWSGSLNEPNKFMDTIMLFAEMDQEQYDQYAKGAWNYAHEFISNPGLVTPYQTLFE